MRKDKVIFYDPNQANQLEARRVLTAAGSEVVYPRDTKQLMQHLLVSKEHSDVEVFVIDITALKEACDKGIQLDDKNLIVLSRDRLSSVYPFLIQAGCHPSFLAKNKDDKFIPRDLLSTVQKYLTGDVFGLDKYLGWGAKSAVFHVRDSANRHEYVDALVKHCSQMKVRQSLLRSIQIVSEELLMNALYDAPRGDNGVLLYADLPRSQRVLLEPEEAAIMKFGCDGERMAVSVSDPYGAITGDTIFEFLSKCFEGGDHIRNRKNVGGAGLGLYLCLNAASHFITNVFPNRRTEFIGIFDIATPVKERNKSHPSLLYFVTQSMLAVEALKSSA